MLKKTGKNKKFRCPEVTFNSVRSHVRGPKTRRNFNKTANDNIIRAEPQCEK